MPAYGHKQTCGCKLCKKSDDTEPPEGSRSPGLVPLPGKADTNHEQHDAGATPSSEQGTESEDEEIGAVIEEGDSADPFNPPHFNQSNG